MVIVREWPLCLHTVVVAAAALAVTGNVGCWPFGPMGEYDDDVEILTGSVKRVHLVDEKFGRTRQKSND